MTTVESTIAALLAPGKGLLAADESFPTIGKRFKDLGISSTEENRRAYREMLFTTPGLGEVISGVILFDETIRQKIGDVTMPAALARQAVIPGIKVDLGTVALAGFEGEKITEGLDGLRERLSEYRQLGARFAKWRAVIAIGEQLPTMAAMQANARVLAMYASLCQEAGLVPIVEPEVLMDGNHTLARCEEVTGAVLKSVLPHSSSSVSDWRRCCSRPAWCCRARNVRNRPAWRKWPGPRCAACADQCPPRCPGLCFFPAVKAMSRPRNG